MAGEAGSSTAVSFGPFQLSPRQRVLLEAGKPVRVGSRALDLLIALLERPGELLSKDELISRVWPTTHVAEGNLKFQIANLRRALRDGQEGRRYLESSSGQGYRFVGDVTVVNDTAPSQPPSTPRVGKNNLPARLTPLIGRDDLVTKLAGRLSAQRLITVVGPGGIGKTSVAIATAEQLIGAYEDGVWSVDLGRLADPAFVRSTVAAAVRISMNPEDPLETLAAALRNARLLLVLDNCSHVIDAVAGLVVAILRTAPGVHILATSREPLRVEGEHIYRLGPLECPPASERLTAAEALRFPAVQLFVDLAAASHSGFELRDEDAPLIGEICRRLDGIPLAIELAAARVGVLGVHGLAARLENVLQVLTGGHRMALPRHRTMRAALDWSYSLLTPPEQMVFSRLAVFAGGFTLDAAAAVASDDTHSQEQIIDLVLELATKSLVAADADLLEPRFRLTEATRAYAVEKSKERGEFSELAPRHAMYFLKLLGVFSRSGAKFDEASAALALEINNLRTALSWAFGRHGDLAIGINLATSSVPVWLSMSLMAEWHGWAERAIAALDEAKLRGTSEEMKLQTALGISFQLVKNRASDAHAALARALELADHLGDTDYQLRILQTFSIYHMRIGEVRTALALARRANTLAAPLADSVSIAMTEWTLGISEHWVGEHRTARRRLEKFLQYQRAVPRSYFLHYAGFDLYVVARYTLAHTLWIQGQPEQAMETLQATLDEARHLKNPVSVCSALAFGGCALCLRTGDLDAAERLAAELVGQAQRYGLGDFLAYGKAVQEILLLRDGKTKVSAEQHRTGLQRWRESGWHILLSSSDLANTLAKAEYADELLAIVGEERERAEQNWVLSTFPELLRVEGELLLLSHDPDAALARARFRRSLELARAQGALSWELRAALSLARLERTQGRTKEASQVVHEVYQQFTEGFDSTDLKNAKQFLDDLGAPPGH